MSDIHYEPDYSKPPQVFIVRWGDEIPVPDSAFTWDTDGNVQMRENFAMRNGDRLVIRWQVKQVASKSGVVNFD